MPRPRPYIPKDKRPTARKTLSDSLFALRWMFGISKPYVLFKIFFAIDSSVILILEKTFLISYIIKIVEEGRPFVDIFPMFLPVTAVVIFNMLFTSWMEVKVMAKWEEKINKTMRLTLYEKAAKMDMAKYDDPTFYNDFVWAMQEAPPHMFAALNSFCTLCSTVAVILIMGGYVIATDPIGLIFLGITLLVTVLLGLQSNKRMMQREEERIPHNRRAGYIKRVFYLADYAKDLRMGEMKDMLYDDYDESEEQEKSVTKKTRPSLVFPDVSAQYSVGRDSV